MIKQLTLSTLAALTIGLTLGGEPARAAGGEGETIDFAFSFEGPFGSYDAAQLQRGLQVYTEVCSACHGLQQVAFRTLTDENGPALTDATMRAFAAEFEVEENGDFRAAGGPDHFPGSSLENAPDLSLITKARAGFHGPYGLGINQLLRGMGGAEYVASFLVGFNGEETEQAGSIFYYNTASGSYVAMNPVLEDGLLEYADGTEATEEQMAHDVAAFLMWAAEPHQASRKMWGLIGVIFLTLLASLLYLTNKRLWAPVKDAAKKA